jgi:neopullulanase
MSDFSGDIQTPDWVKDAIFYQIFPDRFYRSPRAPELPGIVFKPWGTAPAEQGYQGGDLYGIVDKLDYLVELGITALYLNPVFSSASNHRYHTFDYLQVDPLLGGNQALRELIDQAHARDIKIVLDGVFNHASRGFWAFHHILENGNDSPYLDWFHVKDWPLRPYSANAEHPANYAAWWDIPALPKFNTDNPGVRKYLLQVAQFWIDFGIDGWRLDVPADIDDDDFWREFRRIVKTANPEAYIVGEIWHEAHRWLQGDQFDAVMNYPFSASSLSFFGAGRLNTEWQHPDVDLKDLDAAALHESVEQMHSLYDWEITSAQLNLLGSHDTPRALWVLNNDISALRLCVLFMLTMPGAPCIYYGDEIGLAGGKDPHCREAYPWGDTQALNAELLAFVRVATRLRRDHAVLSRGSFEAIFAQGKVYAFKRHFEGAEAVVIFNAADNPTSFTLREIGEWHLLWPGSDDVSLEPLDGKLRVQLPARQAVILERGAL